MKRILMHQYECPKCGFCWRQQVRVVNGELCILCGYFPVPAGESRMRLAPEPTKQGDA